MTTQILPATPQAVQAAAELLKTGGLVAMPTETVYGLGANALNPSAVQGIFAAKGRPADNPLIVHVANGASAEPLCHLTDAARALMDAFCPGPLTLLLPKKDLIPAVTNAGLSSVAIRIPRHPVAQAILKAAGVPIAAPSANQSGKPSPTTAQHVWTDLNGKIPLIIDGGACEVGLESTVLDLTRETATILRPGSVTPEMLLSVLPEVRLADSVLQPLAEGETALSPGMMYKHYAPSGQLWLVKGREANVQRLCRKCYLEARAQGKSARILAFAEHLPAYAGTEAVSIGSASAPEAVAQELFACLRQMDAAQVDCLFCEMLEAKGIGLAIMNRLHRAAAFQVLDADQEP